MAMNNKNTQIPSGRKYKATYENDGKEDFMMIYAESREDAISKMEECLNGTSMELLTVEEV